MGNTVTNDRLRGEVLRVCLLYEPLDGMLSGLFEGVLYALEFMDVLVAGIGAVGLRVTS